MLFVCLFVYFVHSPHFVSVFVVLDSFYVFLYCLILSEVSLVSLLVHVLVV